MCSLKSSCAKNVTNCDTLYEESDETSHDALLFERRNRRGICEVRSDRERIVYLTLTRHYALVFRTERWFPLLCLIGRVSTGWVYSKSEHELHQREFIEVPSGPSQWNLQCQWDFSIYGDGELRTGAYFNRKERFRINCANVLCFRKLSSKSLNMSVYRTCTVWEFVRKDAISFGVCHI